MKLCICLKNGEKLAPDGAAQCLLWHGSFQVEEQLIEHLFEILLVASAKLLIVEIVHLVSGIWI